MHLNSCASVNTSNIGVHQWLMKTHPHLVTEYIQYDDTNHFRPLQLACDVKNYENVLSIYGKSTAVVHYWMRCKVDDEFIIISFGISKDVVVNSIIGLPTLR